MQEDLLASLQVHIKEMGLGAGDRIPAERRLAQHLGTSRNSLRRLLHTLEGRGMVSVKQGSGTVLLSRFFDLPATAAPLSNTRGSLMDQIESAELFIPPMARLAARRQAPEGLERLQKRNVALGQSLLGTDSGKIWIQSFGFFKDLAKVTANPIMGDILQQIFPQPQEAVGDLPLLQPRERNQLFAVHVNILNAVKHGDEDRSYKGVKTYLTLLGSLMDPEQL